MLLLELIELLVLTIVVVIVEVVVVVVVVVVMVVVVVVVRRKGTSNIISSKRYCLCSELLLLFPFKTIFLPSLRIFSSFKSTFDTFFLRRSITEHAYGASDHNLIENCSLACLHWNFQQLLFNSFHNFGKRTFLYRLTSTT